MKCLLTLTLLCASSLAFAAPDFTFQGLPWYSSPAKAAAYLKTQGWDEINVHQPDTGLFLERNGGEGRECKLVANYKNRRLDGAFLVCTYDATTMSNTLAIYREERDTLIKKFGKPLLNRESLQDGLPGVVWSRPGGLFSFAPQANGSLAWMYLAPSRKAEVLAALAKFR